MLLTDPEHGAGSVGHPPLSLAALWPLGPKEAEREEEMVLWSAPAVVSSSCVLLCPAACPEPLGQRAGTQQQPQL